MSVKIMSRIWEGSAQRANKLLLLLAIADSANDDGWAFPAHNTLAKKCRVGRRSVQKMLDELETEKELIIYNRIAAQDSQQHFSNVYHLSKYADNPDAKYPADLRGTIKIRVAGSVSPDTMVVSHQTLGGSVSPDTRVVSPETHESLQETSVDIKDSSASKKDALTEQQNEPKKILKNQVDTKALQAGKDGGIPADSEKWNKAQRDSIYDVIAQRSFSIANGSQQKLGGRIGILITWLQKNHPKVTAQQVTQFYDDYKSEHGAGVSAPAGSDTFPIHFTAWWQKTQQGIVIDKSKFVPTAPPLDMSKMPRTDDYLRLDEHGNYIGASDPVGTIKKQAT